MPQFWISEELRLRGLSARKAGDHAQALKTYMCIALRANYSPNEQFAHAGCAELSYSELQDMTGASRSLVSRGIQCLQETGLIETSKASRTSTYRLLGYEEKRQWAKLPKAYLLSGESPLLSELSLRNRITLDSLKLYLLLISFRDSRSKLTYIGYDKISHYTGIRRSNIRPAISNLLTHRLVDVGRGNTDPLTKHQNPNAYKILGL